MTKTLRAAVLLAYFRRWLFLCVAMTCSSALMAQSLEVIQLKFRSASEVIPVLQPMLESGGVLTGQDYQLFVRTSPQNLQQLRQALVQLDREPRNLLVSVKQATRTEIQQQSASVGVQGDAQRQNGTWRTAGSVSSQAQANGSRTVGDAVSSVRLLEGGSAFISSGASVPMVSAIFTRDGHRRVETGAAIEYRDVTSGFAVTPHVNGNRVVLRIDQQAQQLEGGQIRSQALGSEVSGALGEWIELGGVTQSDNSRERGLTSGRLATNSDVRSLWVKVEAQ